MKPEIFITSDFWKGWEYLVEKADGEVSVLADCIIVDGKFKVSEMYFVPQQNSGGATDMDDIGIARLLTSFVREGKDSSIIRCWIHSHNNFDVFWSDVDTANIRRLGNSAPWFLSIVTNKAKAVKTRLDVFAPVHLTMHDVPLTVQTTPPTNIPRLDEFLTNECRWGYTGFQESTLIIGPEAAEQPELFEWAGRAPRSRATEIDLDAEIEAHENYLQASDPNTTVYQSALAALIKMKEERARQTAEGL